MAVDLPAADFLVAACLLVVVRLSAAESTAAPTVGRPAHWLPSFGRRLTRGAIPADLKNLVEKVFFADGVVTGYDDT